MDFCNYQPNVVIPRTYFYNICCSSCPRNLQTFDMGITAAIVSALGYMLSKKR